MKKRIIGILITVVFITAAFGAATLVFNPFQWSPKKARLEHQPRFVIPRQINAMMGTLDNNAENLAWEDDNSARVAFSEGEVIVKVLTGYFDDGPVETQFVAYRNFHEFEGSVYLTFIDYDGASRNYNRLWAGATATTRPGTISLNTLDLLGDRSLCVLLHGMNGQGEHTLTIFRRNPSHRNLTADEELFTKIAEFRIDGSIKINETERPMAYRSGQNPGQSFTISAFGRDMESSNLLDQLEIVYAYNAENGFYEETKRTRIPGAQVEQRRVREILGNSRAFENFVSGLWYYIGPQGTVNKNQYIFFSPQSREIIFYGDETQQVFNWQNSAATRYGLYVTSQNISVTTLRRTIDIELESLESVRVRVNEDVRLKIRVSAPWDGSYKKAGPIESREKPPFENAQIDARYDGSLGKIHFLSNGSYELNNAGILKQGKYAFFSLGDEELLELRSAEFRSELLSAEVRSEAIPREIYLVEGQTASAEQKTFPRKTLTLLKVKIGSKGIIPLLNERPIALTLVSE
jgi:hypothetical protein